MPVTLPLRAIVRQFGPAGRCVELERAQPPAPEAGQVAVRMTLAAINPSDLITISGAYPTRTSLPLVPGFEGIGTLEDGRRVLPIGSAGAWQQLKISDAAWCFPLPDWLSDEQAATSYVNPMTAWLMLSEALRLPGGAKVAINAANSAIGLMLLKMARQLGLDAVAIVRRPQAAAALDTAYPVVVMRDPSDSRAVQQLRTSGGVDAILDCIGGQNALTLAQALKPGGTFICYGLLSGDAIPPVFWRDRPDIVFSYFHLRQWVHQASQAQIASKLDEVFALIAAGVATTTIAATFPLAEISAALRFCQQPTSAGKVLIHCG